ncbi:hypothetical protein ABK040_009590 [Willaertia magna]
MDSGNKPKSFQPSSSPTNESVKSPKALGLIKRKPSMSNSAYTSTNGNADICEAACLDIIDANKDADEGSSRSSCEVCATKQANNAIFIFESIPLTIKLLFIAAFAIISLIVFGAILIADSVDKINTAKKIKLLCSYSVALTDFINELQTERNFALSYFGTHGAMFGPELLAQMNSTNIQIEKLKSLNIKELFGNGDNSIRADGEYAYQMDYYLGKLKGHRERVLSFSFNTTHELLDFYTKWDDNIIGAVLIMTHESGDPVYKELQQQYGQMTMLNEHLGTLKAVLSFALGEAKFTKSDYDYSITVRGKYDLTESLFKTTAEQESRNTFNTLVLNTTSYHNTKYMLNSIFSNYPQSTQLLDFTVVEWHNNSTMQMANLQLVQKKIRNLILIEANRVEQVATGRVIGFTISTVVVVIGSIIIALFFSRTIIVPWKRLLRIQKNRTKELTESYSQLNLLLERISAEEQKTKKILNSMDDALVTINELGYIVHCNASFYKMFKFTESDIFGKKVKFQQIIPNLELQEMFQQFTTLDSIITPNKDLKAITKVGNDFPVRVNLTFCNFYTNEISKEITKEVLCTNNITQQEKACIALIHNMSEKLQNEREEINRDKMEFLKMFDNPLMRLDFKEFCKRIRADENIYFLEDVQSYKHTPSLQERVQRQQDIYNLYLKPEAKKLLNISKDQIEHTNFKVSKGLGEIDLFESLERIVMEILVCDSFKRWKEMEKDLQSYM